jgi:hypothetical protein
MITHMVLLRFRKDVSRQQADAVMAEIASLKGKVPGVLSFTGGAYSSPEGLNKGYTHAFCMMMKDAASRDGYLTHPEHEKVKKSVLAALDGGLDGVVAFDYAT